VSPYDSTGTAGFCLAEEVGRLILASTGGEMGLVAFYDDDRQNLIPTYGGPPLRGERTRTINARVRPVGQSIGGEVTVEWSCLPEWGAQQIAGWILRETRGGWAR